MANFAFMQWGRFWSLTTNSTHTDGSPVLRISPHIEKHKLKHFYWREPTKNLVTEVKIVKMTSESDK